MNLVQEAVSDFVNWQNRRRYDKARRQFDAMLRAVRGEACDPVAWPNTAFTDMVVDDCNKYHNAWPVKKWLMRRKLRRQKKKILDAKYLPSDLISIRWRPR